MKETNNNLTQSKSTLRNIGRAIAYSISSGLGGTVLGGAMGALAVGAIGAMGGFVLGGILAGLPGATFLAVRGAQLGALFGGISASEALGITYAGIGAMIGYNKQKGTENRYNRLSLKKMVTGLFKTKTREKDSKNIDINNAPQLINHNILKIDGLESNILNNDIHKKIEQNVLKTEALIQKAAIQTPSMQETPAKNTLKGLSKESSKKIQKM